MSIAAQKWAWDQNIPNVAAKFLLVALADQTDARDGAVRYQETSARFFAQKCSMSERTFWRCIAALELNRYLKREGGGGRGKATEFWLCLERSSTETWNQTENPVNLAEFSDDKLCQIVQETVPNTTINSASVGTVSAPTHNTNYQSTQRTSARARARGEGRAPARKEDKQSKDVLQWVCHDTDWWHALRAFDPKLKMPVRPGRDEHARHTGFYFPRSLIDRALDARAIARAPPIADDAESANEASGNEGDDVSGQFAASLSSVSGALAYR